MDLNLDEHKLIAEFRRLSSAGKKDLLDYAALLLKRADSFAAGEESTPEGQCVLEVKPERPESKKEPLFTE